ncbi:MAG: hypothetical protein A2175_00950 [Candidatus Nealsonbacteria bacterium RBG_13_42_11]|uniref:Kazal-like domain-containing protein n=1 Tax=Candidatus Nealsonbacteria bacterium RBG_13_42_11 TaxID=1801663 RepID=A0A1G2E0Z1_9BACT|nr:MAG: hypothetical protein A2175_00950 [Candidatus Nealsonbacteria bacterium RBG_13_42_11]
MLKTKLSIVFAVLSLVFFAGIVSAQENGDVTGTANEEITAQNLDVSEPTLLPGSPFYFLKEWARNIQSTLTFNPVAKANLKEKFSNEKIMELKKLIEQNQNRERIENAIKNYGGEIDDLKNVADKIKEKAAENPEVGKFLDKFVQHQTLHQEILEKLETKVSTTTFEKIEAVRERHLEKFGEVMNKLEENKEQLQERLEKNLEEIGTSTAETIIQIRDRVMEKIQERSATTSAIHACLTTWEPVCGTDGKTYSNACFAKLAGVEVASQGACTETATTNTFEQKIQQLLKNKVGN